MNTIKLALFISIINFFSASFGMDIDELEAKNKELEQVIEGLDTMMATFYDSAMNFERLPQLEAQRAEFFERLKEQRYHITNLLIKNKEAQQTIKNIKKQKK